MGKLRAPAAAACVLAVAACSSAASTTAPAASTASGRSSASATPSASAAGTLVPVLHLGKPVTFTDSQLSGGAPRPEKQTWKLTSVSYISHAEASEGGTDGNVAAQLGSSPLQAGYRYLALGLTITDDGPSGFGSNGALWTLMSADYGWAEATGAAGTTLPFCISSPPLPGDSTVAAPYVSDLCSVQDLQPGQSASGYVMFAVPDAPAAVAAFDADTDTALLLIDPDKLVKASETRT